MKFRETLLAALIAVPLALSSSGFSADLSQSKNSSDLRCMIVSMQMSASEDKNMKAAGAIGTVYYLGRLDGRGTVPDLGKSISIEFSKMTPTDFTNSRESCGALLTARGELLKSVGAGLVQSKKRN